MTDRLFELEYNVHGIDFGGAADEAEEYFNCGSEMWFTVAERARLGKLDLSALDDATYRQLSAELRARRYKIQSDKTLRAESKDDIKKRLKRSPDDADGLCLAFRPVRITARVLDPDEEDDVPTASPKKTINAFTQQVRAAFPAGFAQRSSDEVCGNCLNFTTREGEGFCKERQLLVEPTDPKCEFFDFDDVKELYPESEDNGDDDDET